MLRRESISFCMIDELPNMMMGRRWLRFIAAATGGRPTGKGQREREPGAVYNLTKVPRHRTVDEIKCLD